MFAIHGGVKTGQSAQAGEGCPGSYSNCACQETSVAGFCTDSCAC